MSGCSHYYHGTGAVADAVFGHRAEEHAGEGCASPGADHQQAGVGGLVQQGGAGRALDLTPKELILLTYFLRHPGRILTRSWLHDQVWDEPFDGSSNSLWVHVKDLRRKLEAFGPRVIHTLRGRGFWLGESHDPPLEERR